MPSWYIKTTAIKEQLLAENAKTNWVPANVKDGRYGEWLRNNVDWALSRSRYWGTPLPIWEFPDGRRICVGSLKELSELSGQDLSDLDPHRPYVDDIVIPDPDADPSLPLEPRVARRVPEVIDVWFDSGAMPFAQWGAPHRNQEKFEANFPAQYICEAIDQTRGWFYSLMAVSTLVFGRLLRERGLPGPHPRRGRPQDEQAPGNILGRSGDGRHGATRCAGSWRPAARRDAAPVGPCWRMSAGPADLQTRRPSYPVRGRGRGGTAAAGRASRRRPLLDRWLLSGCTAVKTVDGRWSGSTRRCGPALTAFVDDLSAGTCAGRAASGRARHARGGSAFATLFECLETVTLLMAPIVPFITDHVWQALRRPDAPESVHLASWPKADESLIDPALSEQMALVRRLVELGRAARVDSGQRVRQPLARALVGAPGFAELPEQLRAQIAEELNVVQLDPLSVVGGDLVDYSVKPNFVP